MTSMIKLGHWRSAFAVVAVAVLLFPAIAMTISTDIAWGAEDFLAAAAILAFVWLAIEVSMRVLPRKGARLAASAVVILVALTIWAHLAVGVF